MLRYDDDDADYKIKNKGNEWAFVICRCVLCVFVWYRYGVFCFCVHFVEYAPCMHATAGGTWYPVHATAENVMYCLLYSTYNEVLSMYRGTVPFKYLQ